MSTVVKCLVLVAILTPYSIAEITLPDTGIDTAGHVSVAITALGEIVLVIVGGFFAFKVIHLALRWVGRISG